MSKATLALGMMVRWLIIFKSAEFYVDAGWSKRFFLITILNFQLECISLDWRQHGWHIPDGMKIAFRFYSFPQAGSDGLGRSWSELGILYLVFMQQAHNCNRKCPSPKPDPT